MTHIKRLLTCLLSGLSLIIALPVMAQPVAECSLDSIASKLKDQAPLNQFVQTKQVAILTKPLISKGYLLLTHNSQVVWQTQSPIKSTLLIGQQNLQQFNKHDQPVQSPANSNQQMSQLISSTFLAILAGDFEQLDQHFSTALDCRDGLWQIALTTNSPSMKPLISSISVSGQQHIDELSFTEANGDSTHLVLTPLDNPALMDLLGTYVDR